MTIRNYVQNEIKAYDKFRKCIGLFIYGLFTTLSVAQSIIASNEKINDDDDND
jgi:hypothetical protein